MALHLTEDDAVLYGIGRPAHGHAVNAIRRAKTNRVKKKPNDAAEKAFLWQCGALRLPPVEHQAKFDKRKYPGNIRRRWVVDFFFPDYALVVEIDGGIWMQGGGAHSHPIDITRNMTKRNDLGMAGILVISFTPREVTNGFALSETQFGLTTRGWRCPA